MGGPLSFKKNKDIQGLILLMFEVVSVSLLYKNNGTGLNLKFIITYNKRSSSINHNVNFVNVVS